MTQIIYHVVVQTTADLPTVIIALQQQGAIDIENWQAFPLLISATMTRAASRAIRQHPKVKSCVQDSVVKLHGLRTFTDQNAYWGLDRIDQRSAVLNKSISTRPTGDGVRVYVVDSGVWPNHPQLAGKVNLVDNNSFDAFLETSDPLYSWPDTDPDVLMESDTGNPADSCGCPIDFRCTYTPAYHGTLVASIIAGADTGVAPDATIHSIRVFDKSGSTTDSKLLAGIAKVLEIHDRLGGPALVNLSLGVNERRLEPWTTVIASLIDAGLPVIVSAGNEQTDAFYSVPAGVGAERIAVAEGDDLRIDLAIDEDIKPIVVGASAQPTIVGQVRDRMWPDSNWGDVIDILAPGHEVAGACFRLTGCSVDFDDPQTPTIIAASGTSVAAALVSGIAALYLENEPELTHQELRSHLIDRSTKGCFAETNLSHNRLTNELVNRSILNPIVYTPNRISYAWYVPTEIEWKSETSAFSINVNELSTYSFEVLAECWATGESQPVGYRISNIRADTGSTLPSGFTATVSERHEIINALAAHTKTYGIVKVYCPDIASNQTILFDVTASDGRTGDHEVVTTRTVTATLLNVPKPPTWVSPVAGSSLGTIHQGDILTPIILSATDADGGSVTYQVIAGSLPTGLRIVANEIRGTVGVIDKTLTEYDFVIRATTLLGRTADRGFKLLTPPTNIAHFWSSGWLAGYPQVTIGDETAYNLGQLTRGSPVLHSLEITNPDDDPLTYQVIGAGGGINPSQVSLLPMGLSLDRKIGRVTGVVSTSTPIGDYYFRVQVSDTVTTGDTEEILFKYSVIDSNDIDTQPSDYIIWITPAGNIGITNETYRSHFAVKAFNPHGGQVFYSLSPTSQLLPEGMVIDAETGEIRGVCPFVGSDTEVTFTVRARLNAVINDRTFSFTIKNIYSGTQIMEIFGDLGGAKRAELVGWLRSSNVVPDTLVFRPTDTLWGRVLIPKLYILAGLKGVDGDELITKLRDYHRAMDLRLGKLRWARAEDPSGKHIYDVIYFDVLDPMRGAGGFDSLQRETTVNYPNGQLPEISLWNLSKGSTRFFPNSLTNVRNDLIITDENNRSDWTLNGDLIEDAANTTDNPRGRGIGLAGQEGLPLWMKCEQVPGDPLSILGYTSGIEILHTQPGKGKLVHDMLSIAGINEQFQGLSFTLDRYLVDGYGLQQVSDDPEDPGVPTEFAEIYDDGLVYSYVLYYSVLENTTKYIVPIPDSVVNAVTGIRIVHNANTRDANDVTLENGKYVVNDGLIAGDTILITILHNGTAIQFDGNTSSGSESLDDNGKYYKFPSGDN